MTAVFVTMVAVGVKGPPSAQTDQYRLWPAPVPFYVAFLSVANIFFSYGKPPTIQFTRIFPTHEHTPN
jgi:hypothetical protein